MSEHIFFVCESCRLETEETESAGTTLLKELQEKHQNWSRKEEFKIQGFGCLFTCSRPCVLAMAGTNKLTYLFADLPAHDIADAILQLGDLYAENDRGSVSNYKLPEVLQVGRVARIPPWPKLEEES